MSPIGPAVALPLLLLATVSDRRRLSGVLAVAIEVALNLWWALPLLNEPSVESAVPSVFTRPLSLTVMILGQVLVVVLVLAAFGVFSPRPGSPKDLALRAQVRGDFLAAGEFWLEAGRERRAYKAFMKARAWHRAAEVARTGVDFLAVGALTHSAPVLDLGLDL